MVVDNVNALKYVSEYDRERKRRYNEYYYSGSGIYQNRKWTEDEEMEVVYSPLSDKEIEEKIQRSVCSIQKRRSLILAEGRPWLDRSMVHNRR